MKITLDVDSKHIRSLRHLIYTYSLLNEAAGILLPQINLKMPWGKLLPKSSLVKNTIYKNPRYEYIILHPKYGHDQLLQLFCTPGQGIIYYNLFIYKGDQTGEDPTKTLYCGSDYKELQLVYKALKYIK